MKKNLNIAYLNGAEGLGRKTVENEEVKVDSSKIIHSEQLTENTVVKETIIVTEYDKESGKPIKETEA